MQYLHVKSISHFLPLSAEYMHCPPLSEGHAVQNRSLHLPSSSRSDGIVDKAVSRMMWMKRLTKLYDGAYRAILLESQLSSGNKYPLRGSLVQNVLQGRAAAADMYLPGGKDSSARNLSHVVI